MPRVKQSKAELKTHLKEQVGFLMRSCDSYDAGYKEESKRIANVIRTLFHDTERSHSLMRQLKLKRNIAMFDSAREYDPKNLMSHDGLTAMRMESGNTSEYIPRLETMEELKAKGQKFFPAWWNKIVIVDKRKHKFSRRDLILALANQDGGSHVDPKLDKEYQQLSRENSMGWIFSDGVNESPVLPVELASVRQIAHEVIMTFRRKYAEEII